MSWLKDYSLVNRLLFPAPTSTYTARSFERGDRQLLWINDESPALLFQHPLARYFVIYFHGNATDIGACYEMIDEIQRYLHVHVLVVEYPGYGCAGGSPTENTVNERARQAYDFAIAKLLIPPQKLIIWGRSIGSGVAVELVHKLPKSEAPALMVLVSAYSSINSIIGTLIGRLAPLFVSNRFVSIDKIEKVACPVMLIHGREDQLISFRESEKLVERIRTEQRLHIVDDMDHNRFDLEFDILRPLSEFFDFKRGPFLQPKVHNDLFETPIRAPPSSVGCNPFSCRTRTPSMGDDALYDGFAQRNAQSPRHSDAHHGRSVPTHASLNKESPMKKQDNVGNHLLDNNMDNVLADTHSYSTIEKS